MAINIEKKDVFVANSFLDRFHHVAVITPLDRPKSVRNHYVIVIFGRVLVLSRCFWIFSVGVGAFVIGQVRSLPFSLSIKVKVIYVISLIY